MLTVERLALLLAPHPPSQRQETAPPGLTPTPPGVEPLVGPSCRSACGL